jgi:transposase
LKVHVNKKNLFLRIRHCKIPRCERHSVLQMEQIQLKSELKTTKLESWSKQEFIQNYTIVVDELERVVRENYELRSQKITDEQLHFIIAEQLESLKNSIYGKKSERWKKPVKKDGDDGGSKTPKKPHVKKLSERYPDALIRSELIAINPVPECSDCKKVMTDTGMRETSEQLTVIPKKFEIIELNRIIYGCDCHNSLSTAPQPARITPGSAYSDEMIMDVSLSKYCDLIPINRYVAMASRGGLVGLPANSLIETTHSFADFVSPVYKLIKEGILNSRVLRADETPHKMLEGSERRNWYLWGFSTDQLCYLECRNTRAAYVASEMLIKSKCEVLVSDRYKGYDNATCAVNELRRLNHLPPIVHAHCNSHARRNFFNMWPKYKEAEFYLEHYHEIYQLNGKAKAQPPPIVLALRHEMRPRFEAMKEKALQELAHYPKGKYKQALKYFLHNFETLTYFLTDAEVPIDNNAQERNLRSHVVGRKTWYGTHSERGALTAAILFTIVETCKLIDVNPRQYFEALVKDMLAGMPPYTPDQFKKTLRA